MNVNGYVFDYEFVTPGGLQADSESLELRSAGHQIAVRGENLEIDGKPYGIVKPKDHISVIGGKVTVNGQERQPEAR